MATFTPPRTVEEFDELNAALPALTQEQVDSLDNASPGRFCEPLVLLAVRQIIADLA